MTKESQNIEWKELWRDEYLKWICGFANAQGGKIYIGKDNNGVVSGLKDAERLLEDIPNKISNFLGIIADVNLYTENGLDYIEIVVNPNTYPVSYKGEYHYRTGSTKQQLKGAALNHFLLKKTGITWDSAPIDNVKTADLRSDSFDIFKEQAIRSKRMNKQDVDLSKEELLSNLKLMEHGIINRAGILLFHHNPENWMRVCREKAHKGKGAFVRVGSKAGREGKPYHVSILLCNFHSIRYGTRAPDFLKILHSLLSWSLLCRPGWPQTHRDPPASQVLRLKVCASPPADLFVTTPSPQPLLSKQTVRDFTPL